MYRSGRVEEVNDIKLRELNIDKYTFKYIDFGGFFLHMDRLHFEGGVSLVAGVADEADADGGEHPEDH